LSSARAAFWDGAAAEEEVEEVGAAGFGVGGAVVGERGWDLVADLETAAAIAADWRGNLGNAGFRFELVGFGIGLKAFGGESDGNWGIRGDFESAGGGFGNERSGLRERSGDG
jgi:hypothetical protein